MGYVVDLLMDCSSWGDTTPHCFYHQGETHNILCWSNNGAEGVAWAPNTARSICRKRPGNVCKRGGVAKEGVFVGNDFYKSKDNIELSNNQGEEEGEGEGEEENNFSHM